MASLVGPGAFKHSIDGTQPWVHLRLLGDPALILGDGTRRRLADRDALMFAVLALRGPTRRDLLTALLWPDRPKKSAQSNLRQRLFAFKTLLGAVPITADAHRLELAAGIAHELQDPVVTLRRDGNALTGQLLGDVGCAGMPELAQLIEEERSRWHSRLIQALAQVAAEHEADGQIARAMPAALRLVEMEPLREHGVRLLMRLHHRRGDRGAAMTVFESCRAALYETLGERPSDETLQLAVDIGNQQLTSAPPAAPMPLTLRHPPRVVGREALLQRAEERWHDRGCVLLVGMGGIGKSRVLEAMAQRWHIEVRCQALPSDADHDLRLLGRIAQALLDMPLRPGGAWGPTVIPLLHWLAGDRPEHLPRPFQPERLPALWAEALTQARSAGAHAVAVDDLHAADADSLRLLLPHFASPGTGPRWVLATRERPLAQPLAEWLGGKGQDLRLDVPPLEEAGLMDLVASLDLPHAQPVPWSHALMAHCGGHPLSVIQVLRALHQRGQLAAPSPPAELPIPADVLARTAHALDRGDTRAQQLAFIVALAGADFDDRVAMGLLRCNALDLAVVWRQLQSLGIMEGRGFSHELMRQAVVDAVPVHLRPAIHAELAVALTDAHAAPVSLARHWEAAGEWALAAREGARAASASLDAGLLETARQRWHHAAALFERAGLDREAFDLRCRAAHQTRAAVSPIQSLQASLALLDSARDDRERAGALCLVAETQIEQQDAGALQSARKALRLAHALGDDALAAAASFHEAAALRQCGDFRAALPILQALVQQPSRLESYDRVGLETLYAQTLADCGRRREAVAMTMGSFEAARTQGHKQRAAELGSYAAIQLAFLCRVREALDISRSCRALGEEAGMDEAFLWIDDMNIASNCADLGQMDDALAHAEPAARGLRAAGSLAWAISAENLLAAIYTTLGRVDLAAQWLQLPAAEAPTWAKAMREAALARLAQARGRSPLAGLQRARTRLEQGGVLLRPDVRERTELELARWSEPAIAIQRSALARAWAEDHEHLSLSRLATMVHLEALTRLNDGGRVGDLAEALAEQAAAQPAADNLYPPELWSVLCRAWDCAGRPDRALAQARQAVDWIEDCCARHVPAALKDSFLHGNLINRWLRARAEAHGGHRQRTPGR